ncbi:hypothetical protein F4804DRAFT_307724 [Jackrogersella minutella]|nr:hypothetical protein F4804DRAFT_307724 [Jackrogersella minutella]
MTPEERQALELDLKVYKAKRSDYCRQQNSILKLMDYIYNTVEEGNLLLTCSPDRDLRDWYARLKESLGSRSTSFKPKSSMRM